VHTRVESNGFSLVEGLYSWGIPALAQLPLPQAAVSNGRLYSTRRLESNTIGLARGRSNPTQPRFSQSSFRAIVNPNQDY
jgi:hypothetical protein